MLFLSMPWVNEESIQVDKSVFCEYVILSNKKIEDKIKNVVNLSFIIFDLDNKFFCSAVTTEVLCILYVEVIHFGKADKESAGKLNYYSR